MTSTANNLTTVDADGDKCTANDGSWLCSTFDSWSSYESYLELNNAISIGKQESLFDYSSQIHSTFPTYILGAQDDQVDDFINADADGDRCTANDGSWLCGLFENWSSYESYNEINANIDSSFPTYILGAPDDYVSYSYRGRRNAHMTTHGICEEQRLEFTADGSQENVTTTEAPPTTTKATTTSSQKMKILFLPLFIFTLSI
ncbi:unnamed protein product [Oikopleura dioica]|uniref:Uncharacterized protein n=1 Tax=Oikopleura dioica TaxID=34765 RepID=E4Y5K3_OIKDI|nr:unnamed protein product [Oikopleura dioica]